MNQAATLRARAEDLAGPLPPLLAAAEQLASTVILGDHGRRRAGIGDEFWQYRTAMPGDEARMIDWRRSGRSDTAFVREKEWQAAQSVLFWVDVSQSMQFASDKNLLTKADTSARLAMAAAVLLNRGGERVGLANADLPPRTGDLQLNRLAVALSEGSADDYGAPDITGIGRHTRAVFLSDFLGDISKVEAALTEAADRDVKGALVQVLDPQEEAFPFDGRTIFESVGGTVSHETLRARDLKDRYLERLAERKDRLTRLARTTGWQYACHHTDSPATKALLWIYQALERVHRC